MVPSECSAVAGWGRELWRPTGHDEVWDDRLDGTRGEEVPLGKSIAALGGEPVQCLIQAASFVYIARSGI